MAVQAYRANLSAKQFPLLSEQGGKTVIVKTIDQNFIPSVVSKADEDKDVGIPQIYYCHNVLPTSAGFNSIGIKKITDAPFLSGIKFSRIHDLITETGEVIHFSVATGGRCMILRQPLFNAWQQIAAIPGAGTGLVTVAHVSGISYIYFEGIGCYKYDTASNTLVSVTLTGLNTSEVKGVVESNGYLLAFTALSVVWCSTLDVTDFVPDLVTGAGGGAVEEVKGTIVTCLPNSYGFIIYCTENIVAVTATNNSRFPFLFKGLTGSAGIVSPDLTALGNDTETQYAYTKAGLQQVTVKSANLVFPEITDFLARKIYEDFDAATQTFSQTVQTAALIRKLSTISGRYIAISYGPDNATTHTLVYDMALRRFGKLRFPHVSCFSYSISNTGMPEAPFTYFGLLCEDGAIYRLTDEDAYKNDCVIFFGRYQYVRARAFCLQTVIAESVGQCDCYAVISYDGKNPARWEKGYEAVSSNGLKQYSFNCVGENISIVFWGTFSLNSLELEFFAHGRR